MLFICAYIYNYDVWETIRQLLGMTSYKLYINMSNITGYYVLNDGSTVAGSYLLFDSEGNFVSDYDLFVLEITSVWGYPEANENCSYYRLPCDYDSESKTYYWSTPVLEAVQKGTIIKCKYVFKYGDYELLFNYEIKLKLE